MVGGPTPARVFFEAQPSVVVLACKGGLSVTGIFGINT